MFRVVEAAVLGSSLKPTTIKYDGAGLGFCQKVQLKNIPLLVITMRYWFTEIWAGFNQLQNHMLGFTFGI